MAAKKKKSGEREWESRLKLAALAYTHNVIATAMVTETFDAFQARMAKMGEAWETLKKVAREKT